MRKYFELLAVVFLTADVFAQSPQKTNLQTVFGNSDALFPDTMVGMQISALQGSISETGVNTETQTSAIMAYYAITDNFDGGFNDFANNPGINIYIKDDEENQHVINLIRSTGAQDSPLKEYEDSLLSNMGVPEESDLLSDGFTDTRDGNHYDVVKIGTQIWMAENLKYLPSVTGPATGSQKTPCYYVYGYDGTNVNAAKATANYKTYGVLYNWTAAMAGSASSSSKPSGVRGVCPTGWHLPSDAEWTELTDYLGIINAGGKLKEAGTTHWTSPNDGANNKSGFTALPGGSRYYDESFLGIGSYGYWWSATEKSTTYAWFHTLSFDKSYMDRDCNDKEIGFSVRCVKD